jgi:hypothetical protein
MNNETQQTAVDWLKFRDRMTPGFLTDEDYKQAKEVEVARLKHAYSAGHDDGRDATNGEGAYYKNFEDYYNENYGGNK